MSERHHIIPFLLAITASLPVVPLSCSKIECSPAQQSIACSYLLLSTLAGENSLEVKTSGKSIGCIDIFVYNDDELGRLDCCQRIDPARSQSISFGSTSGRKKVAAIANLPENFFAYEDVITFESLSAVYADISDENPAYPIMSGVTCLTAGPGGTNVLELTPLLCRIEVRHITVDFSDRAYKGSTLDNIRCYLTDVSGLCPVFPSAQDSPNELLNSGRLHDEDCRRMSHPELIYSDFGEGSVLYCYPRSANSGTGPSSRETSLVVEGSIDGVTYYYPVDIASDKGIGRGISYIVDLIITRTGLTSPDGRIGSGPVNEDIIVVDWNEHDNGKIEY